MEIALGLFSFLILACVVWFVLKTGSAQIEQVDAPGLPDGSTEEPEEEPEEEAGIADWFFQGLVRSRNALREGLAQAFGGGKVDETALEALEDALIGADVGVKTATEIVEAVRHAADASADSAALHGVVRQELRRRLGEAAPLVRQKGGLTAILAVRIDLQWGGTSG